MTVIATFLAASGLSTFLISAQAEDAPFITGIVRTNSSFCLISYTNCSDTNFDYLVQSSTNLTDWVNTPAVQGATTNTIVTASVAESGEQTFHRVCKWPHTNGPFTGIIAATNNIYMNGSNVVVDSYDPTGTNNLGGLYNPTNRIIRGDVGTNIYTNPFLGSGNIYTNLH